MNMQELISKSAEVADLLKALANPHRLRILCELHKGERSVSALQDKVGLSQSALSQHLAKLREAEIVTTRREAQTIHYAVGDARVAALLATLYEQFCAAEPAPTPKRRRK